MARATETTRGQAVVDYFGDWDPRQGWPLLEGPDAFEFAQGEALQSPDWAREKVTGDCLKGYPTFLLALGYADRQRLKAACRRHRMKPYELLARAVHAVLEDPEALAAALKPRRG